MVDYGKVRSTVEPESIVIDEFSVWQHTNITPVNEPGTDEEPGFVGYEFNMVQYDKNEFILQQAAMNQELNSLVNTMLGVSE